MGQIVIDPDEVEKLWTEIWHLNNANKSDEYKGLSEEKKADLKGFFYNLLNYHVDAGSKSAEESHSESQVYNSDYDPDIHSPSLYPPLECPRETLWYPAAPRLNAGKTQGKYPQRYPEGAVWHWTSGHRNGLKEGNALMRETGMLYLIIAADGLVGQSNPLSERGFHAGDSSWPGIGKWVSNRLIGIEVQAAGKLVKKDDKFYSWFKQEIPASQVMYSETRGNIQGGYYHMFTKKQCNSLRRLTLWLYFNQPDIFKIENVVGHDEVAPSRKCDPGGAFCVDGKALTMEEVRAMLKKDIEIIRTRQGLTNRA